MELNEMEKKLLFQVEGDYQTKILNELYMTVRYLQRRADLHGVDVPIVDQLVSQLAADAQHLPKLFNGHDVRVFRKHHLVKLSELSFLHRFEPPILFLTSTRDEPLPTPLNAGYGRFASPPCSFL